MSLRGSIRSILFFLKFCILALMILFLSCGIKEMKVTQQDLEQRINQSIPHGTAKAQVIEFLNALEINSVKIGNYKEFEGSPGGIDPSELNPKQVKNYVSVWMPRVGYDRSQFQTWNASMNFYFDKNERLIGHKISIQGDW